MSLPANRVGAGAEKKNQKIHSLDHPFALAPCPGSKLKQAKAALEFTTPTSSIRAPTGTRVVGLRGVVLC